MPSFAFAQKNYEVKERSLSVCNSIELHVTSIEAQMRSFFSGLTLIHVALIESYNIVLPSNQSRIQ